MNALRRVEVVRPYFGEWWMEVCAEADCNDEELLAFANAEWGEGWAVVIRGTGDGFDPVVCIHDRRRMHFVLAWGGEDRWASLMG